MTILKPVANGFQFSRGVLSHPHLYEPQAVVRKGQRPDPNARKSYSCVIILDADTDTTGFYAALQAAANAKFPTGIPSGFNWPVFEFSKKHPEQTALAGRLGIVCKRQEKDGKPRTIYSSKADITDPGILYPGCIVGGYLSIYAYDNVQVGVNCGLELIMFQANGERMDGRPEFDTMVEGLQGEMPDVPEKPTPPATTGPAPTGPINTPATGIPGSAGPAGNVVDIAAASATPTRRVPINPATGLPFDM